jgi:hypothetical protein
MTCGVDDSESDIAMASANQLATATLSSQPSVVVEHLNYGKLVANDDRVPASQGFGVTRRSNGLDASDDGSLHVSTLLDLPGFTPDLIDPSAARHGILVVRWLQGNPPRVAIIRARFRPEDGETAASRLYQQAVIWTISGTDWIQNYRMLLDEAANLRAKPDLVSMSRVERFGVPPHRLPIKSCEDGRSQNLPPGSLQILDFLVPVGTRAAQSETQSLLLGNDLCDDERSFLSTVTSALDQLPKNFDGWRDIVITSGLKHVLGPICIRHLASERTPVLRHVEERDILQRLSVFRANFTRPKAPPSETPTRSPGRPIERTTPDREEFRARLAAIRSFGADVQPDQQQSSSPQGASTEQFILEFQRAFKAYREKQSALTPTVLIEAAKALGQLQRDTSTLQSSLAERDYDAFLSLAAVGRVSIADLPIGHLLDLAEIYMRAVSQSSLMNTRAEILTSLDRRLSEIGILLPAELKQLESGAYLAALLERVGFRQVYDLSRALRTYMTNSADASAITLAPKALGCVAARISQHPFVVAQPQTSTNPRSLGVHGIYPISLDAIILPRSLYRSLEQVTFRVIGSYLSRMRSTS